MRRTLACGLTVVMMVRHCLTVTVGHKMSRAQYYVEDPPQVTRLLMVRLSGRAAAAPCRPEPFPSAAGCRGQMLTESTRATVRQQQQQHGLGVVPLRGWGSGAPPLLPPRSETTPNRHSQPADDQQQAT